ncbi:MAG TPA: SpoIIE family protein phosphatase, partial [Mycobacteriales bacterium]|nr:SpoIIE family protein phosphatase [Mycobacteriales bacterium]
MSHPEVDPLARLLSDARLAAPDQLPALVATAAAALGARTTTVYVTDYAQQVLVPVGRGEREVLSVDATVGGRAFRHVEIITLETGDGRVVWVPLLDGVERLGVVRFSAAPGLAPPVRRLADLAGLAAELLVSKQQYGDGLRMVRRREPMQLPAELQWQLLPPLTFGSDRVVISAILEPSYEIGGDSFDYAVNGDVAHVAVFDAMGHGLEASLLSTVAIGAYRNARRTGLDLLDVHRAIDTVIGLQFGPDRFVTGVLADLDVVTGAMTLIAAGHAGRCCCAAGRSSSTSRRRRRFRSAWATAPSRPPRSTCSRVTGCCCTPTASSRHGTSTASSSGS